MPCDAKSVFEFDFTLVVDLKRKIFRFAEIKKNKADAQLKLKNFWQCFDNEEVGL